MFNSDCKVTHIVRKSETYFIPKKNSCVIILKQAVGRLGNLMFKFASAYGLARFHRCRFYLDEHYMNILNATFTINITFLNIFKWEYLNLTNIAYRDNTACHYSQKLMLPNSIRYLELTGYWQAYRYFINYTDELRQQFTFRSNIIQTIAPFILQELKGRILCQPTHVLRTAQKPAVNRRYTDRRTVRISAG
ncbi:unnamed protein product [Adineta steineri]|uniref:L-Fucosyltransferase n=1 Tax=Adineta steineri TaxID=433720 RepID=A0A814MIW9_9BILA|nr:unnamed protein product [Adineta steineri]